MKISTVLRRHTRHMFTVNLIQHWQDLKQYSSKTNYDIGALRGKKKPKTKKRKTVQTDE